MIKHYGLDTRIQTCLGPIQSSVDASVSFELNGLSPANFTGVAVG